MSFSSRRPRYIARSMTAPPWGGRNSSGWSIFGILVIMTGICSVGNVIWLTHHFLTIPPPWDQAFYFYMGLRYARALADHGLGAMIRELIHLSPDVAPLFPLTSLPLYLLFGPSRFVGYLTNVYYLFLLLLGVYLLGAYVYGRMAGILAAFVVATFTATVNYSRDYLLEFPATAFVTLAMYAFVRSAEFRHRPWCLAFGILAGLSVLTKTMVGVFFIGPVLCTLGRLIWRRQLNAAVLTNSLLSVSMGGLVAAVWWGPNFRTAFGYLIFYGFQAGSVPYSKGGVAILTLTNLSYYALALINYGISVPYAGLLVVLLLMRGMRHVLGMQGNSARALRGGRAEGQLWIWLLVGYALLTVVPNKGEERYAQPLLPPLALLLVGSIKVVEWQWMRRGVVAMVLAIGAFNYIGLTYGLPLIPQRVYVHRLAVISHEYPHYTWVRSTIHLTLNGEGQISAILAVLAELYDKQRARVEDVLRARLLDAMPTLTVGEDVRMTYRLLLKREPHRREVQKYTTALQQGELTREGLIEALIATGEFKNQRASVLVVPDHPQFNASTLRYYAEADRFPLQFAHIIDGPITAERLQSYDFIVTKSRGYQGPEFSTRCNDAIQAVLLQAESGFTALSEGFVFPDDSQIIIYAARSMLN
jgi:hypothetical protein